MCVRGAGVRALPTPLRVLRAARARLQVQAHPDNAPAWRLLGTVHAENDDDRQVRRHAAGSADAHSPRPGPAFAPAAAA